MTDLSILQDKKPFVNKRASSGPSRDHTETWEGLTVMEENCGACAPRAEDAVSSGSSVCPRLALPSVSTVLWKEPW